MSLILSANYIMPHNPVDAMTVVTKQNFLYSPNTWRKQYYDNDTGRPISGEYYLAIYNGLTVWCQDVQAHYVFKGTIPSEASSNVNDSEYNWAALFTEEKWELLASGSIQGADNIPFKLTSITGATCGGIAEGTDLKGWSIKQILT